MKWKIGDNLIAVNSSFVVNKECDEMVNVIATENERDLIPLGYRNRWTIVTGVGAVNVYKALKELPRYTQINNFGYAGSKWFKIGECVEIGEVSTYHPNVDYEEPTYKLGGDVPCYSSIDFVLEDKSDKPCVYDMELAFILAMGFTDVRSQKKISDNLNYEQYEKNAERRK